MCIPLQSSREKQNVREKSHAIYTLISMGPPLSDQRKSIHTHTKNIKTKQQWG